MVTIQLLAPSWGRASGFARRFLSAWCRPKMPASQSAMLGVECAWPVERSWASDSLDMAERIEAAPRTDIAGPAVAPNTPDVDAPDDWDLLFQAVLGRLTAVAQAPPSVAEPDQRGAAAAQLSAVLQDCAKALARLADVARTASHADQ